MYNRSIPYIKLHKHFNRPIIIEVDGTTVGEFYPSQQFHKQAEQFQWFLENLKGVVSDEVVDSFKEIERITKANQEG